VISVMDYNLRITCVCVVGVLFDVVVVVVKCMTM